MIGATLLLAASGLPATGSAGPEPINPETWINSGNYSREDLTKDHGGILLFRLAIDVKGQPVTCKVMGASGRPSRDEITCVAMLLRGHFIPARDEAGAAIASNFSRQVVWGSPESLTAEAKRWNGVDLMLSVSHLPHGDEQLVKVRQIVEPDGTISSCSPDKKAPPGLGDLACQQAAGLAIPAEDESGQPVRALNSWGIQFTTKPLPDQPVLSPGPTFVRRGRKIFRLEVDESQAGAHPPPTTPPPPSAPAPEPSAAPG